MRTSEQVELIGAALGAFQKEVGTLVKNKTVDNGKFSYDYCDLSSMLDHVRPIMLKNGLSFTSIGLTSRLIHVSGQWIEGDFPVNVSQMSAQQVGSAITYARRYALQALLGINAEDDDDAQTASQPTAKNYTLQNTKPTAPKPKQEAPKPTPPQADREAFDEGQEGGPDESVELVTVEAFTKEREDKKGNTNRGVMLKTADGDASWWALYDIESLGRVAKMKGKKALAKLEDKEGFKLCHNLTEVGA